MLGIRTDANKIAATGHVMRCMTIADEVKKLGKDVIFFVADEDSASFVKERGFIYKILGASWDKPVDEINKLAELIKEHDTVLFDSYSFDAEYFEKLKAVCDPRFVYMDDLCDQKMPVDTIINYNIYANDLGYNEKYDVYEDITKEKDTFQEVYNNSPDLKIVGIVSPKEGVTSMALNPGVAYTSKLIDYIIDCPF